MRRRALVAVAFCAAAAPAQEPEFEPTQQVIERVRAGGWFERSRWQRGADGALEMFCFADVGDSALGRFVPLLGNDLEQGFIQPGLIGFLSLVCHGSGDLLSMTDADFHFGALGIDASDVGLRQFLAVPAPSFEGQRGRAELLDRMLAVDLLMRRGCKQAVAELAGIAANERYPAPLRERARLAVARIGGATAASPRRRLDGKTLRLPAAFDGCVIVDHQRLPDLSWLAGLGRRLGALATMQAIRAAGGSISPAVQNGAQRLCDLGSELPFGVAHRYGNARLDHSCVVISAKADPQMPVSITWEAAGEFEHERWQDARSTPRLAANNPLFGSTLSVAADRLFVTTDGTQGMARPAMAAKLRLADDDGHAIRAIVPANSKLWLTLAGAGAQLPAALGAELRVAFGDPGVVVLAVDARDEEGAEAWVAKGKELLAAAKELAERQLPDAMLQHQDLKPVLEALFGARIEAKDSAALAVIEIRGMTPAKFKAIVEVLAGLIG